jgi:predicted HD phosphohydrolase
LHRAEANWIAINRQIDDLRHRLEGGQTLGEIEQLQQVRRQGQHLVAQRYLKNKELNEDLQLAQAEVADRIGGKMMGVLEHYFRKRVCCYPQ